MTRFGFVITTYAAVMFIALSSVAGPAPVLLWNASASAPIGLYAVHPARPLRVDELVVVRPPPPLARWLAARHYLALGVPLVKYVRALPGARVCRQGPNLSVDGVALGAALDRDHAGRALPVWQGCLKLAPGETFLMNTARSDSLDGRYFGPSLIATVVGRATPLWTHP
jgi:conjugative transfer signal peptidase TraF